MVMEGEVCYMNEKDGRELRLWGWGGKIMTGSLLEEVKSVVFWKLPTCEYVPQNRSSLVKAVLSGNFCLHLENSWNDGDITWCV